VVTMGVEDAEDVPTVDLTAERWSVREGARKNLYTGKTYNSVENVQQFFKERGIAPPKATERMPLNRASSPVAPKPASAVAPKLASPATERMPWDAAPKAPIPTPTKPVAPTPTRPVAPPPPTRPVVAAQGGLFGQPPTLIPPVKSRTELPKAPPPPRRPAQTGTVVEHPKYGTGTIVRREGEGDDAKIVVIFQRHGMKKLVEKYAGLKKS